MFTQLLQYNDVGLFLLRIAVAIIFIYHALPKVTQTKARSAGMGMPVPVVFLIGAVEILSSLGLILGILVQLSALLLGIIMIGAIGMKIMKWHVPFAPSGKMGWEFDFILLFACLAILLGGGGGLGL